MSSFPMRGELRLTCGWLLLALTLAIPTARGQGLPAEDVALLLSGEAGGSLALESAAVVWSVESERAELRLSLELPVAGLADPQSEEVSLRWAVYVLDDAGAVVASRFHSMTAERRRLAASGRVGVRILESLEVPVAPVTVRTLVRELGSSRFGLRVLAVDPAAGPRPFVARRREGWIELGAATAQVQPAALAVVPAGGELDLMVPAAAALARGDWILRRQETAGEPEDLPLATAAAPPPRAGADRWRRLRATAPAGAEGRHDVLRRADPEGAGPAIFIVPAQARGVVAWPQAVASAPEPAPREPQPPGRGHMRDAALQRRLLEGFTTFAQEGAAAGTATLLRVINGTWAAAGSDGMQAVTDEALDVGDAVVRADPASLPALLAAVGRLYELCVERMFHPCSGTMRVLLPALLRIGEEAAPGEASSIADAWAVLGRWAIERQAFGQTIDHLRQAARLQPQRPEPRIALAKVYEIAGDYRQAALVLEELLEIRPDLLEARLRLGVQYRRLGRRQAALETLGAAAAEGPRWVRIVAWQELAALHRERGDVERAERILRQAIALYPEEEQLNLQLAALLDAAGRVEAATALLDGLDATGGAGRTPRNRYSGWPPNDLEPARVRLRDAGATRRQALAAALRIVAP